MFILSGAFVFIRKNKADATITESQETTTEFNFDSYLDRKVTSLTPAEKRGLLFMVSIPDITLSDSTVEFLRENHIGGVILLSHNIENETQLKKLTSDLREKVNSRLLISIDQEGGTVVRIPWDKYKAESARDLGQKNDVDYLEEVTKYRTQLLRDLGINLILGPVADFGNEDSFMYDRSYSDNPEEVAVYIETQTKIHNAGGLLTSPKHFPGHGRTSVDSHYDFPVISLEKSVLMENEFKPFKAGIDAGTDFIMIAHIINPQIDSKPASISKKYVDILEAELGFEGLVITDDLKMTGKLSGGIDWGINLTIESENKVLARMKNVNPEEKYLRKLLEIRYKKL